MEEETCYHGLAQSIICKRADTTSYRYIICLLVTVSHKTNPVNGVSSLLL